MRIGLYRSGMAVSEAVVETLLLQRADSTSRVYVARFNAYRKFLGRMGVFMVLPIDCARVLMWLQSYVDRKCVAGTVSGLLDGVLWASEVCGYPSIRGDAKLSAFLAGVKRACPPVRTGPKVAWSVDMLRTLFDGQEPSFSKPCVLRNVVMVFTAFYAMLRASELLALKRSDVGWDKGVLVMCVRRSKTDQAGKGQTVRIVRAGHKYCVVSLIERYLNGLKPCASGFLFRSNRLSSPVSYANFCRIVKGIVVSMGLDPAMFSPHSLRSGGATEAARLGFTRAEIARLGRWRALDSVERYVRIQPAMVCSET